MSSYNKFNLIDYKKYSKENKDIGNLRLLDLECKHIAKANENNKLFVELAKKVDYKWVVFGSHRFMKEDERLKFEIERINNMVNSNDLRPIRIVVTSNEKIFVDNTHWALAYIQRYGENIILKDVPFYIVDFRSDVPLVIDYNNSVIKNNDDILNAVSASGDVEERIVNGWRPTNIIYTLKDFIEEMNYYKSELN